MEMRPILCYIMASKKLEIAIEIQEMTLLKRQKEEETVTVTEPFNLGSKQ